jgi:hypothetical protein
MALGTTLINVGMEHLRERTRPRPRTSPDQRASERPKDSPPSPVYVYGLVDPRTNEVRYVGASVEPWRRRAEHLWEARSTSTTPKAVWLRDILAGGHESSVLILARTTRADWRSVEETWIARYTNLTNKGAEAPEEE